MKKTTLLMALALTIVFASCKDNKENKEQQDATESEATSEMDIKKEVEDKEIKLVVPMEPKSDSEAKGEVIFTEKDGTVKMEATFTGLEEGTHAIHLHEKADCSADDGTSTGGHWNPTKERHGKWGDEEGYHKGDIGNFEADAEGNGRITFETDEWCIGCNNDTKNILEKAVIVHEGADDFETQPTGDAGGRVSCGGVIK